MLIYLEKFHISINFEKKYITGVLLVLKQSYHWIKIYRLCHFELRSRKGENRELLYHPYLSIRRYLDDFLMFYGESSVEKIMIRKVRSLFLIFICSLNDQTVDKMKQSSDEY